MSKHDWKKQFANETERAIFHPITQEAVDELLLNLGARRGSLQEYGIHKVCNVVGQIARAHALGIDPETLRLTDAEAAEVLSRQIEAAAEADKPVIVVVAEGETN